MGKEHAGVGTEVDMILKKVDRRFFLVSPYVIRFILLQFGPSMTPFAFPVSFEFF